MSTPAGISVNAAMPQAVSSAAVMMPACTKPFCWVSSARIVHRQIDLARLEPRDEDAERAHRLLAFERAGSDLAEIRVLA